MNEILYKKNAKSPLMWILVEQQAPPPITPVIVFGKCCDVCNNMMIAEIEKGIWYESKNGEELTFTPTHWMMLPKEP